MQDVSAEEGVSQASLYACIILAGGYSRRMGKDKAWLPFPGKGKTTFVEHLISLLTSQCHEVLLVVRDIEHATHYASLSSVRLITDRISGVGPLMGLYSGLSAMHASHALVVAVDMPFLQPELLNYMLSSSPSDNMLVPLVNQIPQVMLAIYPRSILPVIEARLQEGRRDPRSLLDVAPVRYIEEAQLRQFDPELRSFVNMNTPEEFQQQSMSE